MNGTRGRTEEDAATTARTSTAYKKSSATTSSSSAFDFSNLAAQFDSNMNSAFQTLTGGARSNNRGRDPPPGDAPDNSNIAGKNHQQQQQPLLKGATPTNIGDCTNNSNNNNVNIHHILQASKAVPRKPGIGINAEEDALMKAYCDRLVLAAQPSTLSSVKSANSAGAGTSSGGSSSNNDDSSLSNFDSLQIMSVNDHCLSKTMLRSVCSSGSIFAECGGGGEACSPTTTAAAAAVRPTLLRPNRVLCHDNNDNNNSSKDNSNNNSNSSKDNVNTNNLGMLEEGRQHDDYSEEHITYSTVEDHRDGSGYEPPPPCAHMEEHCDFQCLVNADDDYFDISTQADPPPVQPIVLLMPEGAAIFSLVHKGPNIQAGPLQPTQIKMEADNHREEEDTSDIADFAVGEDDQKSLGGEGTAHSRASEAHSAKRLVVEIHVEEDEIDIEWAKASMGGSSSSSRSASCILFAEQEKMQVERQQQQQQQQQQADQEDIEQVFSSFTDGDILSHATEEASQNVYDEEEDEPLSNYIPLFTMNNLLFVPSSSFSEDDLTSEGRSTFDASSASDVSGSQSEFGSTTMSDTDLSPRSGPSSNAENTSFLTMWSSASGSQHHRKAISVPATSLLASAHAGSKNKQCTEHDEHETEYAFSSLIMRQQHKRKIDINRGKTCKQGPDGDIHASTMEPEGHNMHSSESSLYQSESNDVSMAESNSTRAVPPTTVAKDGTIANPFNSPMQVEKEDETLVTRDSSVAFRHQKSSIKVFFQSSFSGEEEVEEPSESASQLLRDVSPKARGGANERRIGVRNEGITEQPGTGVQLLDECYHGSSESNIFMSGSGSPSRSYESEIEIDDVDYKQNTPPTTFQPPSSDEIELTLSQPYGIKGLTPDRLSSIGLQMKKKEKEPALISSLIRKVGSYDAQIIAEKTRQQLLRTATAQSLERHATSNPHEEGNTISLKTGSEVSLLRQKPRPLSRSDGQVSPGENSLFSMFSSSSSSSTPPFSGDDQGSQKSQSSRVPKSEVETADSDSQPVEVVWSSGGYTSSASEELIADMSLNSSYHSEQQFTADDKLDSSGTENDKDGNLPGLTPSGDSHDSRASRADSPSSLSVQELAVQSETPSENEPTEDENTSESHSLRDRFRLRNLKIIVRLRSILSFNAQEQPSDPSLREPLLPQTVPNLVDEVPIIDNDDRVEVDAPPEPSSDDDIDLEEGHGASTHALLTQQPPSCCSRLMRKCGRFQRVLSLFGFVLLLSVVLSASLVAMGRM